MLTLGDIVLAFGFVWGLGYFVMFVMNLFEKKKD